MIALSTIENSVKAVLNSEVFPLQNLIFLLIKMRGWDLDSQSAGDIAN
jgi:hypothetical protein